MILENSLSISISNEKSMKPMLDYILTHSCNETLFRSRILGIPVIGLMDLGCKSTCMLANSLTILENDYNFGLAYQNIGIIHK